MIYRLKLGYRARFGEQMVVDGYMVRSSELLYDSLCGKVILSKNCSVPLGRVARWYGPAFEPEPLEVKELI